jgi:DNA-binding beta-propeller fold protein YncE
MTVRAWPFSRSTQLRLGWITFLALAVTLPGCDGPHAKPQIVYGQYGLFDGEFVKPRAAAYNPATDRIYIVDFAARIQVFDSEGHYVGPTWTTPDYRNGRPSGLSIARDGNLLVSDSHYHCLRFYRPDGTEIVERKIGGEAGTEPGQFGYISDAVQDEEGSFYVAEFGENQRISKLAPDGHFLCAWGSAGQKPGQFARVRALTIGPDGNLYVADACNHRIQVFSRDGSLVACWGEEGTEPGQLAYPYDVAFNSKGELYVVEYGNHRVQKFTKAGKSLGCWCGPGGEPGQLHSPWALVIDGKDRVHVIDSENHRVQRFGF